LWVVGKLLGGGLSAPCLGPDNPVFLDLIPAEITGLLPTTFDPK